MHKGRGVKEGESSPRNTVLAFTGRNKNLAGTKSQKLSHLFQSVVDFAERGQEQGSGGQMAWTPAAQMYPPLTARGERV